MKEPDPALKQKYPERIGMSGDLLLSLVNDTPDLSRIESGKMRRPLYCREYRFPGSKILKDSFLCEKVLE